eukprot:GFUD01006219.1.p1 GENE.GFUD01006219.1~~GFUD01006219.1.p1  ORF type:complete len:429 (+),score=27.92 GFUD01006219.1:820-2106(+)
MTAPLFIFIYTLSIGFLIFWMGLWLVHILAIIYGKWKLHRKVEPPDPEKELDLPGVSIIKPLCGTDTHLFQNLETFFTLQYKKYELLFCIQDLEDSISYMYVKSLIEKYPDVEVRVFRGGENVGVNPKINNMIPAYKASKYSLLLVSDSGIKMKEDTLSDMVLAMKENVGLVHQMPYTCDGAGLPSTLEKVYFGTFHARIYLTSDLFGVNCATGMSALMRKELLDNAGGFQAFGCYLAEDFFFAKAILEQNYKLAISTQPAAQNSGNASVSSFQNRISRWIKLRSAMVPHTALLEPFSECMLSGALAALSSYILFRTDPICFYLVHILVWFISDWILIHIVQNGNLPFNKFEFLVMWMFRECGAPYLFLHAILNPAIRWRTLEFKLKWGGKAEPLPARTNKNIIIKDPATIKFSKPEELCPLPLHVIN